MAKANVQSVSPVPSTETELQALVDRIGALKAELAPKLAKLEAQIGILKAMGPKVYEGVLFQVNVFDSERNTLDMEAVKAKLSRQFIAANTTTTNVRTAKVTARKLADVQ